MSTPITLVQVTDLHITLPGQSPGAGVDSSANLTRAVAAINALDPQPQLVIASGDLVEFGTDIEYERLRDILQPLHAPYRLMAGNHDDRDALAREFGPRVSISAPLGLQQTIDIDGLRVVLLDSLIPGATAGALGEARLDWLDRQLGANDAPAMVFVHHPPIEIGVPHVDDARLLDAGDFARVLQRNRNVVRVACGHWHRETFSTFAGTTLSVCPSTAHQFIFDLRPGGRLRAVASSPAFHLHRWDGGALRTFTMPLS